MPSGVVLVLAFVAIVLVVIAYFWLRDRQEPPESLRPPSDPRAPNGPAPSASVPPHAADAPEPRAQSNSERPEPGPQNLSDAPVDAGSDGEVEVTFEAPRDSDPEITMIGTVPDELLEMLRGKASRDDAAKRQEEEAVDIDVEALVDESEEEEPTGKHALILVVGVARSDRGRKRLCNEDAFLVMEDEPLFVVADGMGGHNAGEVASQRCVEVMEETFRTRNFRGAYHPEWPRRGDELVRCIHQANTAVHELAQSDEKYEGMGTTVVAVRFSPNKQRAYIAHVGDSRCYRMRSAELHQLTEDHTLGRLMGAKGKAARHLAQAVGVRPDVAVDLTIDEPQPGDRYLVCSDGLTKMVPDDAILTLLQESEDLEATAQKLIQEANERGGRDNITVILIRVERPGTQSKRPPDAE